MALVWGDDRGSSNVTLDQLLKLRRRLVRLKHSTNRRCWFPSAFPFEDFLPFDLGFARFIRRRWLMEALRTVLWRGRRRRADYPDDYSGCHDE
jgi:hypothetical protein